MKKLLYLLLAVTLVSCYDDIGNYNYNEVKAITIEDFPEKLGDLIVLEDTIRISPTIGPKELVDNDEFEYHWSIKKGTNSDAKMVRFSDEKDLVLPVTISGDITLMLEVVYKETGITKFQLVSGKGVSKMSNGMYLLKETADGNTEIDMIGFNTLTGEATTYPDLISILNNGQPLAGRPVTLDYWGYRKENYELGQLVAVPALRIASNQDILVLDTNEFDVLGRFEDLFLGEVPTVRNIQALKSISTNTTLVNDGKVYCFANYSNSISGTVIKEFGGNKFLPALIGDYAMASQLAYAPIDAANTFMSYDTKTSSFYYNQTSASTPRLMRDAAGTGKFDNNLNSDLIFVEAVGTGAYATNLYALLRNKSNPDELTFYDLNPQNLNSGILRLNTNGKTILKASDYKIDDATHWAVHQHRRIIYFAYENAIWKFDCIAKTETKVLDLPADEEITHIDVLNEYYTVSGATLIQLDKTKFIIATSSGDTYHLYKHEMAAGDVPAATPYFTSAGTGKIKDYIYIKPTTTPMWMRYKY